MCRNFAQHFSARDFKTPRHISEFRLCDDHVSPAGARFKFKVSNFLSTRQKPGN
jgi:hypothetical protein